MRFDSVIYLISHINGENDIGDSIKTPNRRETFAEKSSVRRTEFYQAAATGFKPELTFTVWTLEYNGESELEYEGKTYSVDRTFQKNDKETELTCSGLAKG